MWMWLELEPVWGGPYITMATKTPANLWHSITTSEAAAINSLKASYGFLERYCEIIGRTNLPLF